MCWPKLTRKIKPASIQTCYIGHPTDNKRKCICPSRSKVKSTLRPDYCCFSCLWCEKFICVRSVLSKLFFVSGFLFIYPWCTRKVLHARQESFNDPWGKHTYTLSQHFYLNLLGLNNNYISKFLRKKSQDGYKINCFLSHLKYSQFPRFIRYKKLGCPHVLFLINHSD